MKMCKTHWDALRAAIDACGLNKLVSKSGDEVVRRMVQGGSDPLMDAHNLILANALDKGGLAILMDNEDGTERCPVCYLGVPEWIEFAARGIAAHYVEQGLKPPSC